MQRLHDHAAAVFPSEMAPEPIAFMSSNMSVDRREEVRMQASKTDPYSANEICDVQ